MKVLVTGRWLFTGAAGPEERLDEGAVLVEGGQIRDVGSRRVLRERYRDARLLGSDRHAVMPGLVNAHHHSHGASSVQHGVGDDVLEPWILSLARKRTTNTYLNTLLSSARLLRTGVTTVVDMFSSVSSADQYAHQLRNALQGYAHAGIRVAYAAGFKTDGFLISGDGEDRRFIESLPAELKLLAARRLPGPDVMTEDEYFAIVGELHARYAGNPRVDLWFGPPGPQWVSPPLLGRIAEAADALDVGVQTHVNESLYEMIHARRFYGEPAMVHLERLGVLSPRFSIAHGVWLNAAEMETMARTGASVSHNPSSNLRLRAGVAPLAALLARGVNVALGMDGTTLDDDEDMFAEMRLALRVAGSPRLDGPAPSVRKVWELATLGGARLYGRPGLLGRLAAGYAADLVLVDLERLSWPWVAPEADPLELVLLRARAGDVDTVMVEGEVVFEHGRPTRFDLDEAARAFADALDETPFPAESAEMVELLRPRIEAWYRRWEVPALDPWLVVNSK